MLVILRCALAGGLALIVAALPVAGAEDRLDPPILPLSSKGNSNMVDCQVDVVRVPARVIEYDKGVSMMNRQANEADKRINPAETIRPTRMVMVTAWFPYRRQLEEYRRALRAKDLAEVQDHLRFAGLLVFRRMKDAHGQMTPWQRLDQTTGKRSFKDLISSVKEVEPLDPKLAAMAVPGLVMPLPPIAGELVGYPLVRLKRHPIFTAREGRGRPMDSRQSKDLKLFHRPWEDLSKELKDHLSGKSVRIFDSDGGLSRARNRKGPVGEDGQPPELVLVRFVDIDVDPGRTYEYGIHIRALNPNFGRLPKNRPAKRAPAKELLSPVNHVGPVVIPRDIEFHAVDEKSLLSIPDARNYSRNKMLGAETLEQNDDRAAVQIHRWVDRLPNQAAGPGGPVGAWLLVERLLIRRGDAIGREVRVDVPRWDAAAGRFELPPRKEKKILGTPVDFTVVNQPGGPPAILVDFSGGRQTLKVGGYVSDESCEELLVLAPDGKLCVRIGREDPDWGGRPQSERAQRWLVWKRWIDDLSHQDQKKPRGDLFE
jgi:hypothetical protein